MTSTTQLTPLRYDTPTVTLEVMTREAAVSQWSDKPVVQVLRYQLQIRDLSGEAEPIEIRGDRTSFLPLVQAIETYVQAQLSNGGDRPRPAAPPYLAAQGLTQHTLQLGRDRTTTGQSQITLGAIQLADLEQVLDELNRAVRPLPVSLGATRQQRPWRQWGATAAGLVAAVGVTTVLWPNYQSQQGLETAQPGPTADQETALSPDSLELDERAEPEADPSDAAESGSAATSDEPSVVAEPPAIAPGESRADGAPDSDAAVPTPTPRTPAPASTNEPGAGAETSSDRTSGDVNPSVATEPPPESQAAADATTPAPTNQANMPPAPATNEAAPASPPTETEMEAETAAPLTANDSQRAAIAPAPGSLADLVQQVRDRWTPPAGLEQTLSYTLVFAADGTLVDVIPADELASEYRDRTGIPSVGTVGLPSGAPQRVLLLLQSNGEVDFRAADADQSGH